jgi:hypothetical protein
MPRCPSKQVGALVDVRVTAIRLYWVEVELCSILNDSAVESSKEDSGSGSSNNAVAGMKGRIPAVHISAAPLGDLESLLSPGDMVKVSYFILERQVHECCFLEILSTAIFLIIFASSTLCIRGLLEQLPLLNLVAFAFLPS